MTSTLLTNSRLGCFRTCPKKHQYAYELGIRKERTSQPLRMGSAVHLGLDELAKGVELEVVLNDIIKSYMKVPEWADAHEWMTEGYTVQRLVHAYAMRYEQEKIEVVATEFSFNIPIKNPDTGAKTNVFTLAGKVDKIVRLPDGRLAIIEHKTTSDSIDQDSDYWAKLRLDSQITLYFLAAREHGYDVNIILYDVIRKPGIDPKQVVMVDEQGLKIVLDRDGKRALKENILKNGQPGKGHGEPAQSGNEEKGWTLQTRMETSEEFADRLTNDIASRPDFYFRRMEVARTDLDLRNAQKELWMQQQAIRSHQLNDWWIQNTNACLHPYKCEYTSLCFNSVNLAHGIPEGFVKVDNVHPELELPNEIQTPI